jgi:hypothetical protein
LPPEVGLRGIREGWQWLFSWFWMISACCMHNFVI